MGSVKLTETAIISVEVKSGNTLTDPATSMTITLWNAGGQKEIDNQAMTKDSTGKYHTDFTPSSTAISGKYYFDAKATDGSRVSIESGNFTVQE